MTNALLLRRRGMMSKNLPYDVKVEFLKATNGAYIEIPHGISGDTYISCDGIIPSSSSDRFLLGSSDGWQNRHVMLGAGGTTGYYLRYGTNAGASIPKSYAEFGVRHTFLKNGVTYKWGNYTKTGANFTKTIQKTYLFAGTSTGEEAMATGRDIIIYNFTMSDNDYRIDLIPVRVGQVGYLYDRVSGQLFGNAGTGDFVLGPDIT